MASLSAERGQIEVALIYDLHAHSNASDGILSPEDLVARAKLRSVDVLALTDHDTTAGLQAASRAAQAVGVAFVAGIEFSTQWQKRGIHVLGLNIDPQEKHLAEVVTEQHRRRLERAHRIAERLEKLGFANSLEGARRVAGSELIGRPHFARYMVEAGHVQTVAAAFKKYLGSGKVGDVAPNWLSMTEIIHAIRRAGGVATLAHPRKYNLSRSKICALADSFKEEGGQGIEVISGSQARDETQDMVRIAERFDLCASVGSDFHEPDRPWQELGACGSLPSGCTPVWQLWQSH